MYYIGSCGCNARCLRTIAFSANASNVLQSSDSWEDLTLDHVISNIGEGLDSNIAKFTAPLPGAYVFHASSIANGNGASPLMLLHNGQVVMTTGRSDSSVGPYPFGSNQVILYLKEDDVVELKVKPREGGFIKDIFNSFSSESDISFAGYRLAGCVGDDEGGEQEQEAGAIPDDGYLPFPEEPPNIQPGENTDFNQY